MPDFVPPPIPTSSSAAIEPADIAQPTSGMTVGRMALAVFLGNILTGIVVAAAYFLLH